MSIAYDAASSSAIGTGNLTWDHTPVGTPKGVLVFVLAADNGLDEVTGVTYGGETLVEVALSPLLKTTTVPLAAHAYFLGSGIPSGVQEVVVTVSNSDSDRRALCYTVTSSQDSEVQNTATWLEESTTDPTASLALSGEECWVALASLSDTNQTSSISPLSGWTSNLETQEFFSRTGYWYRYNTVGTSDVTIGYDGTELTDSIGIGVAIKEGPPAPSEEMVTFSSNSHIYDTETETFNSDSNVYAEEIFNSNSHIWDTETATFSSDSHIEEMAYGDISAVIDTLAVSGSTFPDILVLDGDYVVVVGYDGNVLLDGNMHTFTINSEGAISDTVVDSWLVFDEKGKQPKILKLASDKYLLIYDNAVESFVKSLTISTTGVITKSFIDTLTLNARFIYSWALHTGDANNTCISNCFAGVVETYTADSEGAIGDTVIDSQDYGHGGQPGNVVEVSPGYYVAIYKDNVETFSLDVSGNITAVDSWDWTEFLGRLSRILKVPNSTKYLIAYEDQNEDGALLSFSISDTGTIAKSTIDSLVFEPGEINHIGNILSLGSGYFAITGMGNTLGEDGVVYTFSCDTDGNISDSVLDTMEFYDGSVNYCQASIITHIQGDVYAVVYYRQNSTDGIIKTFTIELPLAITATFNSDSHIWDTETETFNSDSHLYAEDTATFSSDSYTYDTETATFNSDSHIGETETATFNSNSHLYDEDTVTVQSDARIISRAQIENEYRIPKRIQPTMRNTDTTPQTGTRRSSTRGFRIL
ncbi:hypothetical protein LCGC14_1271330 [marine sediment metagenome]|uniref:Uncharacterized protein n=1 Tax=marine sediment metagenome TaxID=412755 RepID=A0A0F9LJ19_9ZZZZ